MFNNLAVNHDSYPVTSGPQKFSFIGITILILLSVGVLSGCANHKPRTQELLAENYHSLSDDELILYYYRLEDQIEVVERKTSDSSISLGLGLGSFGRSRGTSGGVGLTTGRGQQDIAINLRDRRNEVKLELQQRNLKP